MSQSQPSAIDWQSIFSALIDAGLDRKQARATVDLLPADTEAVMLYGSRARGDATDESDVDILAVVSTPRGSRTKRDVNLSCYTIDQLSGASRTLFGFHIARDGILVADNTGETADVVAKLESPDPVQALERVRHMSAALDVSRSDVELYLEGLVRLARYLLRTSVYLTAIRQGRPCFSLRELAVRLDKPELETILSSNRSSWAPVTQEQFNDLRNRLAAYVGELRRNAFVSLAGLAVNEWYQDRDRSTLAILAMSTDAHFDYAQLPKVLL